MKIALFDYGVGNLHSLNKALKAGGAEVHVTSEWSEALNSAALVLPGVGSFGAVTRSLEGNRAAVLKALRGGLPCLGICLGMQLLFESSEEGPGLGIGVFSGRVRRLRASVIPQMGWNDVDVKSGSDPIFVGLESLLGYFANSYVCEPEDPDSIVATATCDADTFPAAVRNGRTWGVQFHPEKSSAPGLRIIRNFLAGLP